MALGTGEKRCSYNVFFGLFPVAMSKHFLATLRALLAGVPGIYPGCYDATFPCLVFGVFIDPPFEPVSPLGVAALGIAPFFRLQIVQMFKHNDRCSVFLRKLNDPPGDSMGFVVFDVADFLP